MPLSDLEDPPIVEVVCGFFFRPIAELDPLSLGPFWSAQRERFPRRAFVPALRDSSGGILIDDGLGPIRTWLISADDQYVLQVQNDRLYVNWRKRGDAYPTFSGKASRIGLRTTALQHFLDFQSFVRRELGAELQVTGCELAKIDQLEEGRHWRDLLDLTTLLAPFVQLAQVAAGNAGGASHQAWGALPPLSFQLQFPMGSGAISVDVQTALRPPAVRVLKVETKISARKAMNSNEIESQLAQFNTGLNTIFEGLMTPEAMGRFRKGYRV